MITKIKNIIHHKEHHIVSKDENKFPLIQFKLHKSALNLPPLLGYYVNHCLHLFAQYWLGCLIIIIIIIFMMTNRNLTLSFQTL